MQKKHKGITAILILFVFLPLQICRADSLDDIKKEVIEIKDYVTTIGPGIQAASEIKRTNAEAKRATQPPPSSMVKDADLIEDFGTQMDLFAKSRESAVDEQTNLLLGYDLFLTDPQYTSTGKTKIDSQVYLFEQHQFFCDEDFEKSCKKTSGAPYADVNVTRSIYENDTLTGKDLSVARAFQFYNVNPSPSSDFKDIANSKDNIKDISRDKQIKASGLLATEALRSYVSHSIGYAIDRRTPVGEKGVSALESLKKAVNLFQTKEYKDKMAAASLDAKLADLITISSLNAVMNLSRLEYLERIELLNAAQLSASIQSRENVQAAIGAATAKDISPADAMEKYKQKTGN